VNVPALPTRVAQELSNQVVWQGVAYGVLAQNVLIFTAGIVFRLCRRHGDNAF